MPFPLTPSQTASNTPTPSITASVTPSITPSLTNCPGTTPLATLTPTQTNTPSITATQTNTASVTPTLTPTNTPSESPTNTPSVTPTLTPTNTQTNTPTLTNTSTVTPTPSVTPSYPAFSGTGANAAIYDMVKNDGTNKLYLGGAFTLYNGATQNRLVRINENGSKDTGFDIGTGFNSTVFAVDEDTSNGKVYAGGSFTTFTGTSLNRLLRLNSTGSRDTTFSIGTGFNNNVHSITVQSDGKVYVGGTFTQYSGESINRILRLNTNGSRDTSFNVGTGIAVSNTAHFPSDILIDNNGKIVVIGQFTGYNGTAVGNIVRLNTDGTIDTTFSSGTGFNTFAYGGINQQSDGKYVIGGEFGSYNGTSIQRLTRLNYDGTIDTTFTGVSIQNAVLASTIDNQNRVYIQGAFTLVNGVARSGIARILSGGTLDTSYVVGTGFSPRPDYANPAVLVENSGSIFYGNNSTSYSGQTIYRLLRTNPSGDSLII